MDMIDLMVEYETTGLEEEKLVELFQHLVDTGLAWQLQGSYGRAAQSLIQAGLITQKGGVS